MAAREEIEEPKGYALTFKNSAFRNQRVELDEKAFLNCEFEDCMLIVERGETDLSGCRFKNCTLSLRGNAHTVGRLITLFAAGSPLQRADLDAPIAPKVVEHGELRFDPLPEK